MAVKRERAPVTMTFAKSTGLKKPIKAENMPMFWVMIKMYFHRLTKNTFQKVGAKNPYEYQNDVK